MTGGDKDSGLGHGGTADGGVAASQHGTTLPAARLPALPAALPAQPDAPLPDAVLSELERTLAARCSPNTLEAYRKGIRRFVAWCDRYGRCPLPASPDTVAAFLAAARRPDGGEPRPSTLAVWRAAIDFVHKAKDLPSPGLHPRVEATWQGIRRSRGIARKRRDALLADDLRALVAAVREQRGETHPRYLRDRAVLALGFGAGLRRSELVALTLADVSRGVDEAELFIQRSKGDQVGEGAKQPIFRRRTGDRDICPVDAVVDWLAALVAAQSAGSAGRRPIRLDDASPLLRAVSGAGVIGNAPLGGAAIARIVKEAAEAAGEAAGFPEERIAKLAGHSLRRGAGTTVARAGGDVHAVKVLLRHKSVAVAEGYIQDAEDWRDHPGRLLE